MNNYYREVSFFRRFFALVLLLNVAWVAFLAWAIFRVVVYFTGG